MARAAAAQVSIVVLTGAGVSADSGLATFRDSGGLWEGRRPEDVATPEAWAREPETVWRFYQMRRKKLLEAAPNPAHRSLARFQQRVEAVEGQFLLVTQNVDDLHERGGSQRVLHMHGELAWLRCERCAARVRDLARLDGDEFLPCARCGGPRLRPDVVWFGEIPYHLDEIASRLSRCTHFIAVGTSGVVWPAAGFLAEARARGARTTVQGLAAPENLHPADAYFPGRSAEILPPLLEEIAAELRIL